MSEEKRDKSYYEIITGRWEVPPPPPPGTKSPFKTLTEWLTYICDNNLPPEKSISYYLFAMTEPPEIAISLTGYNVYDGNDHRIDFKPAAHMDFCLPKNNYDTSSPQIKQQLLTEASEFFNTDKFRHSFLSNAALIKTNYGEQIWPVKK